MYSQAQRIQQLCVLHRPHNSAVPIDSAQLTLSGIHGLKIDTCQRELLILHAGARSSAEFMRADAHVMHGATAYNFLLQTITGLNSSVPGETNVQGQFRRQWIEWRHAPTSTIHAAWTNQLMHELLADSSTIRAHYLQGIGGNSYGSLVRKLLAPTVNDRILFVGMGELAQSMLELFSAFERGVWNRHALELAEHPAMCRFAPAHIQTAANWATQCVITTPPDAHNDNAWADAVERADIKRIVHLGRRRNAHGPWAAAAAADQFLDLDHLFQLQSAQSNLRTQKIVQARRACTQRAAALAGKPAAADRLVLQSASLQA